MKDEEKPIAKFIRLHNGDDLIAEVIETEDESGISYTLFHPLKVVYIPSETDGYLSIAFMPWVFPRICDQQEFIIHSENVMLINDVTEKMNIYYWESVDTYMVKNQISEKDTASEIQENPEQEIETYNQLIEQLSNKRTLH